MCCLPHVLPVEIVLIINCMSFEVDTNQLWNIFIFNSEMVSPKNSLRRHCKFHMEVISCIGFNCLLTNTFLFEGIMLLLLFSFLETDIT